MRTTAILLTLLLTAASALAVPSIVEETADGVYVVRDDTGRSWGGWSMGVAHMNSADYRAKKILDLSNVPEDVWERTREVRLSAYIMVRDYSANQNPPADGLDEAFEVIVNGNVHTWPTDAGFPTWQGGRPNEPSWHDFSLPKDQFVRGPNEIIFHKAEDDENDDYLYLGIDNIEPRGNSSVTFEGEEWTQEKLTIPGGNGEYMVRLYLITRDTDLHVTWRPGAEESLDDPAGIVLYAGSRDGETTDAGLALQAGQTARVEWRPGALDRLNPAEAAITADGATTVAWLDEAGEPIDQQAATDPVTLTLAEGRSERTSGVVVTGGKGGATLSEIALNANMTYHPQEEPIDMAPVVAEPPPLPESQPASCQIAGDAAVLSNGTIEARFDTGGERLTLTSLVHGMADTEMARSPEGASLFLVEVGEDRYAGSRDFRLEGVTETDGGFIADLRLDEPALQATLTVTINDEGLRMAMELANAGEEPADFKLAFPVLQGLAISDDPADDYYFFPWGGGIIADRPALLRGGYGDHQVLYQVMDLYAPAKGAGLSLRIEDPDGWHKNLALQKTVEGRTVEHPTSLIAKVRDEFQWTEASLDETEGIGMSAEYLRRTREPGESFAPEPAVLGAHGGDWHVAMQRYADWAHEVWDFRPYPSRLHDCRNMIAAGWGQSYLYRDGKYRTDIIKPRTDVIELMSWWDWSDEGPFGTPIDRLDEIMTEAEIERWSTYMVEDPVTGQKMWNNAPSDYRGYNERFGGLPAFREAIETYRNLGADLVTLYTDPFRLHQDCETGRAHGEEWGVVGVDGEKTRNYLVWNPCHDLPEVREWVATEMGRVMRETGADGIRLDEYGHRGWACYDETHDHTYAEWGITQWQKAVTETTRMVHEAMDEVRPDLVLTTEHPGYDYMMQHLEGCITYDMTVLGLPAMRPVPCNIQRFYFRECKPYELDHRGADPQDRKKFWNAVESFGRYYPPNYYTVLSESEDTYWLGESYPLLVTPGNAQYVYVNRFSDAQKTIWHLYNATGHTFESECLAVELDEGEHLFDLLGCREIEPIEREDGLAGVSLHLERDGVASIVRLQDRLNVARSGNALRISADLPDGDCRLVVASAEGEELLALNAIPNATFDLTQIEGEAQPACVKLLQDGQLVDAAEIPQDK